MTDPRSYLPSAAAQSGARLLSVAANLVSLVLVARLLGTETFGRYAFVMAYVNIACSLADLGTTSVLARGVAQTRADGRELYFGNFCMMRGAITALAAAVAVGLAPFIKPEFGTLLLVGALAVPVVASRFFDPVFQVCGRPRYSVYASLVYALSLVATSLVILVWARLSLLHYLVGWAACNLLYTLTAAGLTLRLLRPRFRPDRAILRSILTLAAPLGVGALFYIINTRADTLMLGYMRPTHEVGLYGAAFKLLDLGTIAATTLLWPLVPILSRSMSESREAARLAGRSIVEGAGLIAMPVAVTAPFVADAVIGALYGPGYGAAARIIGVFGVVFLVLVYCLVGVVLNISAGQVRHAYWNTALAVLVNVSLNLVLIPRYGFVGAAYATLASHLCMLAVQHYYVIRHVGWLFEPAFWIRALAINLVMFAVLAFLDARAQPLLVLPALAAYAALLWWTGLVPGSPAACRRPRRGGREASGETPG